MSSLRKSWQKKKWNYLCKEKRSTWGLCVSNTTTIVRRTRSPGLLLQIPPSMLLKFPESPKTQKDSPRIQMIRNSERQKVSGIRLKEAILSPEFFPRKKLMLKAGSTPHTLKQQKWREGDFPRGSQSISGRNNHSRSQSRSLFCCLQTMGKISKYRYLSTKDEQVSQYVSSDT